MQTEVTPARDPIRNIIGTCAAQTSAIASSLLAPLFIGALIVSFGVGETDVGTLITVELFVIGVVSIAIASNMHRVPHHWFAIGGTGVTIVACLLTVRTQNFGDLYLWRIVAGLGCGVVMATVNAAIAQARSPVLLYGLGWATAYVLTASIALGTTHGVEILSFERPYTWLAGALLLLMPVLWLLPRHTSVSTVDALPPGSFVTGCVLMSGIAMIGVSMMAYYAFVERLAHATGASSEIAGRIVAGVQVGGVVGGLIAAPMATRFGLLRALVVGTLAHGLAVVLAIQAASPLLLGIVAFLEGVTFICITPIMFALAAEIDRQGRWAAAGAGVLALSTAVGPLLGGALIEGLGYGSLAWLQLATMPAVMAFLWVGINIQRIQDQLAAT